MRLPARLARLLVLAAAVLAAGACGQKGPLTLPDEMPEEAETAPQLPGALGGGSEDDDNDDNDDNEGSSPAGADR